MGDFFGELALKEGSDGLRKATITCVEDGMLAIIDRASFTRLLGPLKTLDEKDGMRDQSISTSVT